MYIDILIYIYICVCVCVCVCMYLYTVAHVNLLAAHKCDSVMADFDLDHDDSDAELEIATTYVQLCIEYVQKYYMKHPMCTNILSNKSHVKEVLEGNP